jgi:hypothetical protein
VWRCNQLRQAVRAERRNIAKKDVLLAVADEVKIIDAVSFIKILRWKQPGEPESRSERDQLQYG